jgi:hypothetical protein
LHQS